MKNNLNRSLTILNKQTEQKQNSKSNAQMKMKAFEV